MNIEREIKVMGMSVKEMEELIENTGGFFICRKEMINIMFDNKNIITPYGYLRLRITRLSGETPDKEHYELTFKEDVYNEEGYRESVEHNIAVDNVENTLGFLKAIGYEVSENRTKMRTVYMLGTTTIEIDEWDKSVYPEPYMEIEFKNKSEMEKILSILKIKPEQVSTKSINQLIYELNK